jgi:ATP-dependent DNA helicase RecG
MNPDTGLDSPIQYLKGIGPARAKLLGKLGIEMVAHLLFHIPRRYVDRSAPMTIRQLSPGDEVTVFGRVVTSGSQRTRNRRQLVTCLVKDDSGMIEAAWFHRPDLKDRFKPGQDIMLSGKVTAYRGKRFVNPSFELIDPDAEFSGEQAIIPVYPLTEGLSVWAVRRAVRAALDRCGSLLPETLPREVRDHYGYPGIVEALEAVHFPQDVKQAEHARERLVYDELFYLELVLALRHRRHAELKKGRALPERGSLTGPFRNGVGFTYTKAQDRVLAEILRDMGQGRCMNRLLQGDVGSGKTVVALHAMLVAVENKTQAVMMAPTEILATQHFHGWRDTLTGLGVDARLLTGSTRAAARRELLAGLESGTVSMVFGTHALIEEGVKFNRLGLVVVDEQHRFGVMQRAALLNKGVNPDFLVMTATPIPPGRKPVVTRIVGEGQRDRVYGYIEERIAAGEQAFFVCPLIEQSEKLDLVSATETFDRVRAVFSSRRVALVHGRMKSEERGAVMERLRARELDILVSTTVIEVGVDIPNATVMVIEHPDRFGLAQLHQLRGRIGRGGHRAVCVLMIPHPRQGESAERLRFFAGTTDGFRLAEKDLELRGPGEILGTRQHGLPDLRIADIVRDRVVLSRARDDAFRLVELDPELNQAGNELVKRTLVARYEGREELIRVG